MSVTKLYTAADLAAMDSDAPYELIEGELVEVSPAKGRATEIALNIVEPLRPFVRRHKLGRVSGADGGYLLARDPDTVRSPDVGFIRAELVPDGLPEDDFIPHPPDLAVEVMSPSDRWVDAERKARRYLDAGTRLVWVVRPDRRSVVVFAPGRAPVELGEDAELDGEDVLPGFRLPVAEVFADPLAS
jgi:Uma2 family endonuclease